MIQEKFTESFVKGVAKTSGGLCVVILTIGIYYVGGEMYKKYVNLKVDKDVDVDVDISSYNYVPKT